MNKNNVFFLPMLDALLILFAIATVFSGLRRGAVHDVIHMMLWLPVFAFVLAALVLADAPGANNQQLSLIKDLLGPVLGSLLVASASLWAFDRYSLRPWLASTFRHISTYNHLLGLGTGLVRAWLALLAVVVVFNISSPEQLGAVAEDARILPPLIENGVAVRDWLVQAGWLPDVPTDSEQEMHNHA